MPWPDQLGTTGFGSGPGEMADGGIILSGIIVHED